MSGNADSKWISFAKVADKDAKGIVSSFKKKKIDYKIDRVEGAEGAQRPKEKSTILYIDVAAKHEAQKIIDRHLLEQKLKHNKQTSDYSPDWKLVLMGIILVISVLVYKFLEFAS